jgi:hypothetical protein
LGVSLWAVLLLNVVIVSKVAQRTLPVAGRQGAGPMKTALFAAGIGTAIAFVTFAQIAVAQEITSTYTCHGVGGELEPLGDREGHAITANRYTCSVDSGPMSGGVLTGWNIWEWDGLNAVQRSNFSVIRKPGATLVWVGTGGKLSGQTMKADGKVTSFIASGQGTYVEATGSAPSLVGKSDTWTAKSTVPGNFTIENKVE